MIDPLDLRTFTASGPFTEAQVDQNWTDIQDAVNALVSESNAGMTIERRSSSIEIGAGDRAKWIKIISGTFTQDFSSPSDIGDAWHCIIENAGTGQITISSSDGRTNWVMYPQEARLFQCDGVDITSLVLKSYVFADSSAGTKTWVKPPGYAAHEGHVKGGGGSGGIAAGTVILGGGGGACAIFSFRDQDLSDTESYTVGAGGTPATTAPQNGSNGGDSTFNGVLAEGGGGGQVSIASSKGNAYAPSVSNPAFTASVVAFYGGCMSTQDASSMSVFGGGRGAGNNTSGVDLPAGTSIFSGNGGALGNGATLAGDGQAPSGGGGAMKNATVNPSGAGADGEFMIRGIP